MTPEPAIEIRDLRKFYGASEVLRGVSLSVAHGIVYGLLGPNGAGKTTLLETIMGLRIPSSGTVRVLGLDPARDRAQITARVAVQPQSAALFPTLTVLETLDLFASFHSDPRTVDTVRDDLDLTESRAVRVKNLSGGQQRRLLIGIALIGSPDVLILDEPSAGLDPHARRQLWHIIGRERHRGTTIILSTHHMDEATEVCDRIAILVGGEIAAEGEPAALIREHSTTTTVSFTVPLRVTAIDFEPLTSLGALLSIEPVDAGTATRVEMSTEDPDALLRRLTFTPALQAQDFSVNRSSLEKLFLDVTSEP